MVPPVMLGELLMLVLQTRVFLKSTSSVVILQPFEAVEEVLIILWCGFDGYFPFSSDSLYLVLNF